MSELTKRLKSFSFASPSDWIFQFNKIYIFPTKYGLLYLLVIFIMILTGATYANNLIYLLGFFLFSVFASGMVQTHSNLNGTDVEVVQVEDTFAGEPARIHLKVKNQTKKLKQTLRVQVADKKIRDEIPAKAEIVEAHKSVACSFYVQAKTRGCFDLPRLKVYTNFPVGLFESWMFQAAERHYFVYPSPENYSGSLYRLWGEADKVISGKNLSHQTDSDFKEHRPYRAGESYRHIDWKAFARKRPLLVKTFDGDTGVKKIYCYADLGHLNPEQRLRQLSFWITESLRAHEPFQLVLPNFKSALGEGSAHARTCLRELASFPGAMT
jgi:uncharacterized protein (DUF58 family)